MGGAKPESIDLTGLSTESPKMTMADPKTTTMLESKKNAEEEAQRQEQQSRESQKVMDSLKAAQDQSSNNQLPMQNEASMMDYMSQ